ncbi:MAG TPA: ferritin-like domain-containing protein [Rhizomicrobium sp.]
MTGTAVYKQGWTLDDVQWAAFDRSKATPRMIAAIKAAALVELNAPDYVAYLKRVFKDNGPDMAAALEQWGREESQHGRALGRWAEMADPAYRMDEAFARFRAGYKPEHFDGGASIRGSRRGEMIARCVVESSTSSYYSAIRDATEEPVLKEVAGRIAADEYRHYKLFYETLHAQSEPDLPFWKKLMVAASRITESDDDELAFAYYCANVAAADTAKIPYRRAYYARAATHSTMTIFRRNHVQRLVQMVAKAVGAEPHGRLSKLAGAVLWRFLRMRGGYKPVGPAPVAA